MAKFTPPPWIKCHQSTKSITDILANVICPYRAQYKITTQLMFLNVFYQYRKDV